MALFIVGTPIGNLGDITFRAIETLKKVNRIYAEYTRRSRILLNHYLISTPLESFHHHSSPHKLAQIIEQLTDGQDIAYITDAGTPGIQDPGGLLVEAARQADVVVLPIPGVSAVTSLLSVAGISTDRFYFAGYVPTKKGRQTFLKDLLTRDGPVVFFETAPRLLKLFDQLVALEGAERTLIIGRELTKQFEEIQFGTVLELQKHYQDEPPRGELTLVLTSEKRGVR